ncbi:MAG: Planktothrix phage PaV-LD, partial [Cyanobacteriota bacterium]
TRPHHQKLKPLSMENLQRQHQQMNPQNVGTGDANEKFYFNYKISFSASQQVGSGGCMIVIRSGDRTSPILTDCRLSPKANAILAFILSHPTPWVLKVNDLWHSETDDNSVLGSLSELYKTDYLLFFRWQLLSGNWVEEYLIFESLRLKNDYLRVLPDDRKQYICDPRPPAYKRLGGA